MKLGPNALKTMGDELFIAMWTQGQERSYGFGPVHRPERERNGYAHTPPLFSRLCLNQAQESAYTRLVSYRLKIREAAFSIHTYPS